MDLTPGTTIGGLYVVDRRAARLDAAMSEGASLELRAALAEVAEWLEARSSGG